MRPEALPLYHELKRKFEAGDLAAVKSGLAKLWLLAPEWPRTALLEAFVHKSEGAYLSEIAALRKMLALLENGGGRSDLIAEGYSRLGSAYAMIGDIHAAVSAYQKSADSESALAAKLTELSNAIFAAHYAADYKAADFRRLFAKYRALLFDRERRQPKSYRHDKLRLGLLSGNFRRQPLIYFLWPLLKYLPRNEFSLYGYDAGKKRDGYTENIRKYLNEWHEVADWDDEQIAEKMRSDELDVLLELDGHSAGNRLSVAACRPAAVQIFGLGYMGSTGLYDVDYFLTDKLCLSFPGSLAYLTESPLTVAPGHLCFDPIAELPEPTEIAPCERNKFVTFGCFNNFSKVTDEILLLWGEIMEKVPGSRLVLKHRLFDGAEGREFTLERFDRLGLDSRRIELRGFSTDYLTEYGDIDLALDTFPYTGALTTCEALYMGVPVISCYGERPGSAFGRSILNTAGLGELAAPNFAAYVQKAVALAKDRELINLFRKNLRSKLKNSPLMDGRIYAAGVAAAIKGVYFSRK